MQNKSLMNYLRINSLTENKAVVFPLGDREKEMLSESLYNLFKDSLSKVGEVEFLLDRVEQIGEEEGRDADYKFDTCEDQSLGRGGVVKISLFDGERVVSEVASPVRGVKDLEILLVRLLEGEGIQKVLIKDLAFEVE